jgi:hypothetical protein
MSGDKPMAAPTAAQLQDPEFVLAQGFTWAAMLTRLFHAGELRARDPVAADCLARAVNDGSSDLEVRFNLGDSTATIWLHRNDGTSLELATAFAKPRADG